VPIGAYKLFRLRKNGTLGPLFINAKLEVPVGVWIKAEAVPTKGFAFRPGWHCCSRKSAPHLSKKGRVWCHVFIDGIEEHRRPKSQGGLWYTAQWLKVEYVCRQKGQAS
jgi:hypothetical protein